MCLIIIYVLYIFVLKLLDSEFEACLHFFVVAWSSRKFFFFFLVYLVSQPPKRPFQDRESRLMVLTNSDFEKKFLTS